MPAADKLQLICPRCHATLTLDCGFAGSVCRCSSCGELLSVRGAVPQDDQNHRPDCPLAAPHSTRPAAASSPPRNPPGSRRLWPWVLLAVVVGLALATAAASWLALA